MNSDIRKKGYVVFYFYFLVLLQTLTNAAQMNIVAIQMLLVLIPLGPLGALASQGFREMASTARVKSWSILFNQ